MSMPKYIWVKDIIDCNIRNIDNLCHFAMLLVTHGAMYTDSGRERNVISGPLLLYLRLSTEVCVQRYWAIRDTFQHVHLLKAIMDMWIYVVSLLFAFSCIDRNFNRFWKKQSNFFVYCHNLAMLGLGSLILLRVKRSIVRSTILYTILTVFMAGRCCSHGLSPSY